MALEFSDFSKKYACKIYSFTKKLPFDKHLSEHHTIFRVGLVKWAHESAVGSVIPHVQEIFGFDEFFRETLAHQLVYGFHFQVSQLRVEFFDVLTVVFQCAGYLKYKNPKLKFCTKF